jgi:hypothetical protein
MGHMVKCARIRLAVSLAPQASRIVFAAPVGVRAWRSGSSPGGPRGQGCRPVRAYCEMRPQTASP